MQLALAEIRRRRGRWASIIGAVAFIVFLVLILAALADGLFIGSTGALRNSDADAFVYSADGRRSLVRSELPIADLAAVADVDGVAEAGALGVLLATAATDGDLFDIAVIGHLPGRVGEPTTLTEGRRPQTGERFVGLADVSLRDEGDRPRILGAPDRFGAADRGDRLRLRRPLPAGRHAVGDARDLGVAPLRDTPRDPRTRLGGPGLPDRGRRRRRRGDGGRPRSTPPSEPRKRSPPTKRSCRCPESNSRHPPSRPSSW